MAIHEPKLAPGSYPVPVMDAKAEPTLKNPEAESFYAEALRELNELGLPFLLAGTYALSAYTGITRPTKDLDIFCKAGDYTRVLSHFKNLGYAIEIEDERWLGKVFKGQHFFDVIFASSNGTMPIGDQWFENARQIEVFGSPVRIVGPTELVWSKCFIQLRHRYDGADVAHTILKAHDQIDWQQLLAYMEVHWEVLLIAPPQLPLDLSDRAGQRAPLGHGRTPRPPDKQLDLPPPQMKVCRGRMFSRDRLRDRRQGMGLRRCRRRRRMAE